MAGTLTRYAGPLITPSILLLICHERLIDVAEELAGILEDASSYMKITTLSDFKSLLPSSPTYGTQPRMVLMPKLVNKKDARLELYKLFSSKEIPVHYIGCIALTDSEQSLRERAPGKYQCDIVSAPERTWLRPEFTCIADSSEEVQMLKRFIATTLPFFI